MQILTCQRNRDRADRIKGHCRQVTDLFDFDNRRRPVCLENDAFSEVGRTLIESADYADFRGFWTIGITGYETDVGIHSRYR